MCAPIVPDGDIEAPIVIACDGVNSFLAKEAGLYHHAEPEHFTLGAKEVLALPRDEIDAAVRPHAATRAPTSRSSAAPATCPAAASSTPTRSRSRSASCCNSPALGRVRASARGAHRRAQGASGDRAARRGGELKEYSAHLIPEGGYDTMPDLAADGLLVAGDAAGLCLAAGIWLEGVNFAIGSGARRGGDGDRRAARRRLSVPLALAGVPAAGSKRTSCCADHQKLRRAPELRDVASGCSTRYPSSCATWSRACSPSTNPMPKTGGVAHGLAELRRAEGPAVATWPRTRWTS